MKYTNFIACFQESFAESMLPYLIQALLATKTQQYYEELKYVIQLFFSHHFNAESGMQELQEIIALNIASANNLVAYQNINQYSVIHMNKMTIKSMLNVVECIRIHNFK